MLVTVSLRVTPRCPWRVRSTIFVPTSPPKSREPHFTPTVQYPFDFEFPMVLVSLLLMSKEEVTRRKGTSDEVDGRGEETGRGRRMYTKQTGTTPDVFGTLTRPE